MRLARSMVVLFIAFGTISIPAGRAIAQPGPTAKSALAAEDKLTQAIHDNDANAITKLLDSSWAVISGRGGVGEGPSIFPEGIKSGALTRKTFETSEPRVRLYGDVALITTKVHTSGMFGGKPFDVTERQTDVWLWKDGSWKCVLTHETLIPTSSK
ncbi:MAG TPA: nuclear transport factor 2 family protein [Candidatus Acidoferrales bacterium]|nr:nuclear transport factor 2 family protein [Candidatus Acidoferrales bacterium]